MGHNRVLIVEDERLVAEDLRDTLTQQGYDVAGLVATGEKAIDKVAEVDPDVVLMDIHLAGEMDGISAAREIRNRHGTPVVYLTAFSNDQTLTRARETDAFGFVVKPFQDRAVIAAIEMALGKREKDRARRQREELFRSGLMRLPLGVIMTDEDSRIVFANATARLHIGRSLDGERPVRLDDVFTAQPPAAAIAPADDAGTTPTPTDAASESRGALVEITGRRLDVVYSQHALVGDDGRSIGQIVVYQDAEHPPFPGELGRLLRSFMQSTQASPNSPAQFVTICSWSKRIKVNDASWVSFEDFLSHYIGLHVTHGMSPEVAQRWIASGFKDPGELK
ncbi:MAG: response regulator [Opitutaceae bacterium]|nr:response regulator [Opitutaceae bacterium]